LCLVMLGFFPESELITIMKIVDHYTNVQQTNKSQGRNKTSSGIDLICVSERAVVLLFIALLCAIVLL